MSNQIKSLIKTFLQLEGKFSSVFHQYSKEYKEFLSSGYKCPNCKRILVNFLGNLTLNIYSNDGSKHNNPTIFGMHEVECPHCNYRWLVWKKSKKLEYLGVRKTIQSQEFIGEENPLIDNSKGDAEITGTINFTRTWSKLSSIDYEKVKIDGVEAKLGPEFFDVKGFNIKRNSQEKIREKYSISEREEITFHDETKVTIGRNKKVKLIIKWKNIYQHGFIQFNSRDNQGNRKIEIPFKILDHIAYDLVTTSS